MGKKFWNFQRQGGNEKFSEAGEEIFRGGVKFFWIRQGGTSKLRLKNNFENDIDLKVKPEISFLNISLYSKQF